MCNAFLPLLKKLSAIRSEQDSAISFFYFPETPDNKAHTRDRIVLKDLVRDAKKRAEAQGKKAALKDLDRLGDLADRLAHNGNVPLALFACAEHGIWEEKEAPGAKGETRLEMNGRFHLRPLAEANDRNILVVLADRVNIRFLRYSSRGLEQFDKITSDIPRKARTDGFAGYDAGHNERHVENWEMIHFKELSAKVKVLCEGDSFDGLVIVCRAEIRPEIEPHLHTYASDKLIAFLDHDPVMLSEQKLQAEIARVDAEHCVGEHEALIREVVGETQRNGRGALGLRNVLMALEKGEVQALLVGEGYSARVAECTSCGHLDTRTTTSCGLCGQSTREIDDVVDVLTTRTMQANLGITFVDDNEFAKAGNIGALLRFRADQNTPAKLAS